MPPRIRAKTSQLISHVLREQQDPQLRLPASPEPIACRWGTRNSTPCPGAFQSPRRFATQCFAVRCANASRLGWGWDAFCGPRPSADICKARLLLDAEVSRKGQAVALLLPCPSASVQSGEFSLAEDRPLVYFKQGEYLRSSRF